MPSDKSYLDFILEQLSYLPGVSSRAMMGEYVLYYAGKVFGGIYDNRFLVKATKSAVSMMPDARMELPYDGAKEMVLVNKLEDREFLSQLIQAIARELPEPRKSTKHSF